MTSTAQLPPDLLTVPAAAQRLGVSPNTIYRMAASDAAPAWILRIGKSIRVSTPRLERYLHGDA